MDKDDFASQLLDWYKIHGRSLPWRGVRDPYAVLVSEYMAQQTRVETVIPYYHRWMSLFPTVRHLAAAPLDVLLKAWEGLGYYARARNLHKAAIVIETEYNGVIPQTVEELRRLPGIGLYTAAAVASLAFGVDEPALDGNLRRVLARLTALPLDTRSPKGEAHLLETARRLLPPGRAGDFNQALMDLSNQICLPKKPLCSNCPLLEFCQARQTGHQADFPVKTIKPTVPTISVTAGIIKNNGLVLLSKRPAAGLLGGLWEFPGGKQETGESLPMCLTRELREELGIEVVVGKELGVFKHAYSHYKVVLHAFECQITEGEPRPLVSDGLVWTEIDSLEEYAMGKIDRMISKKIGVTRKG